MTRDRRALVLIVTLFASLLLAVPASAVPAKGCATGWDYLTIQGAAEIIWPGLLNPDAFGSVENLEAFLSAGSDHNDDDGWVCLKIIGGERLNPNSHWYKVGIELIGEPTRTFIVVPDNPNVTGV